MLIFLFGHCVYCSAIVKFMLIDTHAHLWFDEYRDDLGEVLERARTAGVEKMIVPGTDIESCKQAVELAKEYPGVIYAAIGIHPEEVLNLNSNKVRPSPPLSMRGWTPLPSRSDLEAAVAIGEIGTDASTEELKSCMGTQKELFRVQCELALEYDLPVIIHTRNSLDEALQVLDALPTMPKGQFHCFSHDEEGVKQVLARGFYVSFCGNITWSKRVAKLVSLVADERLLLETDSPLMWAGARNEPSNVAILAEKIAQLRGQNMDKVAEMTSNNAIRLFRL